MTGSFKCSGPPCLMICEGGGARGKRKRSIDSHSLKSIDPVLAPDLPWLLASWAMAASIPITGPPASPQLCSEHLMHGISHRENRTRHPNALYLLDDFVDPCS